MRDLRLVSGVTAALLTATAAIATTTGPAGASAYVAVQPSADAVAVAQAMATDPATVTGASWVTRPPESNPTGIVVAPVTGFPTHGNTAGILSTGDATIIATPNSSGNDGDGIGGDTYRGTDDATVLKIDFTVPAGVNCMTSFDFRFLSEEYQEFVGSPYNDAFIAELDNHTWSTSGFDIVAEDNFAFDPANSVISVNAAGVTSMAAGFGVGTTFDGGTPRLRAKTPITPGAHSLYLTVFDQSDDVWDSVVVIDNIGFGTVADPTAECSTGATVLDPIYNDDYVPFEPKRLLETRPYDGHTTFDGQFQGIGKRIADQVTAVTVGGRGGVPVDAVGVALNVTVTEPDGGGHITVWPCGDEQPTASNLNYSPGQTTPNAVITRVGVGGQVCLYTKAAAHLVVDVTGFMPGNTSYIPMVPDRLLDTRQSSDAPTPADSVVEVQVTDGFDVPDDARAAVLNVTAVVPTGPGYVTVYPCDAPRPTASTVNYSAGSVVPGLVIVKLSEAAGAAGKVCLYTKAASHLVVDLAGYFPADAAFHPVIPQRLLDTRGLGTYDGNQNGTGALAARDTIVLNVRGRAGVPAEANAVALNVIATDTTGRGYVTVYPCGITRPVASGVNYEVADTRSNAVVSQVGADGTVCLYTLAGAHLVADITGYFLPG